MAEDLGKKIAEALKKAGLNPDRIELLRGAENGLGYPLCKSLNLHTVGYIATLLRRAKAPAGAWDALLTSVIASTMSKVLDLGLIVGGSKQEAEAYGYPEGMSKVYIDGDVKETILNVLSSLTGDDFAREAPAAMAAERDAKGPGWVDDVLAEDEKPFDPFGNDQPTEAPGEKTPQL